MATAGIRSEAGDEFSGGALLPVAASLRWSRPDLTAGIAEHVAQRSLVEGDRPLWLAASGWYVHGRSATGDGREAAADVVDRLRTMARRGALITSDGVRLCVELAGLAQENGDVADARALASVALEAADGSAELELDALVVLVRCALADGAKGVDELLARARTALMRLPGQGPAAVYALVMAAVQRAAGRCDDAVSAAVDGLRQLGVLPSEEATVSLCGHLADALGAQWIGTLLDHDRVHEARAAAESISGARTGGIPSRQAAQLRLSIARATAGDVDSTRRGLAEAADMAAAADTPSLVSACRTALAGLEEQAANVEAALASMRAGVAAERTDQERGRRFRALLTTLGAPDSWEAAPSRREPQLDQVQAKRTGGRRRAASGDDERRLVAGSAADGALPGDREETSAPTQASAPASEPVAAEVPARPPRRRRAAPEAGAEGEARDVLRELLKGSPLGDALAAELRADGLLAHDGLTNGHHVNGGLAGRGRADEGPPSNGSAKGGAEDSGTRGGDTARKGVEGTRAEGARAEGGAMGGIGSDGLRVPSEDARDSEAVSEGPADTGTGRRRRYGTEAGRRSASAPEGSERNGHRATGTPGGSAATGDDSATEARSSVPAEGASDDWLRAAIAELDRVWGSPAASDSAAPGSAAPDPPAQNHDAPGTTAQDRPGQAPMAAEPTGQDATAPAATPAEAARHSSAPDADQHVDAEQTSDKVPVAKGGRATRHATSGARAWSEDLTSADDARGDGGSAARHGSRGAADTNDEVDDREPDGRGTGAGEEFTRATFGSSVVVDLVRGDERMSTQAAQEALRALTERVREHLPVHAAVRDDGPDELVVVLPGHGRAATAAWLHPVLRELADHVDPARGLAGARLRGSVHGTNGRAGVQLIQDIVASAEPTRRRHATADDSGGLRVGGLTDGGLTDGGLPDGGSADDRQADEQRRTSEDARAEGDDARPTTPGRRARRRAAASDPFGPASYVLGASEFSGSAAEESGPLLGDLLYRELSGAVAETPVLDPSGSATDVGDTSGRAGAGRRRRDEATDGERSEGLASRRGRHDGDEPGGRRARREAAGHGPGSAVREDSDAEDTAVESAVRSVTPRAGSRRRRAEDSSFHISDLEIRPGSGGRRHRDDEESVESGRPRRGADVADPTGAPTPIRRSRQPAADGATSGRRRRRSWDVSADSLDRADLPADGPRPGDDGARNGAEAGGAAAGRADAGRADAVPAEGSRTDTDQTDRSRTDESRTNGSRSDESRTDAARTDPSRTTEGRRTEDRTIEGSVDRSSTDRDGTDGDPTRERPGAPPATSDDPTDFGENLGLGDLLAGALAAYRGL
ncbi:MAG: collagen type alpha [Pseudonocardiales bacterium]|nr:collagen type alpha [Pseudonocardiales bacterium]